MTFTIGIILGFSIGTVISFLMFMLMMRAALGKNTAFQEWQIESYEKQIEIMRDNGFAIESIANAIRNK